MKQFGLIGYPLSHSMSKIYFTEMFRDLDLKDHFYQNFELKQSSGLKKLIEENPELIGLNVTIPHKISLLNYVDKLSPEAREIGAINAILIARSGLSFKTKGFNTDCFGFEEALTPLLTFKMKDALVLGNGGAANAVRYVLSKLGIQHQTVGRTQADLTYTELTEEHIKTHKLIINTTPLGMYPNVDSCPDIPYSFLSEDHLLFDLVYNPSMTLFLKKGKAFGAQTVNGLHMLYLQAEKSWEIWNTQVE